MMTIAIIIACQPRWHATHVNMKLNPHTLHTLAHHPCKQTTHVTHAIILVTIARYTCKHAIYATHANTPFM